MPQFCHERIRYYFDRLPLSSTVCELVKDLNLTNPDNLSEDGTCSLLTSKFTYPAAIIFSVIDGIEQIRIGKIVGFSPKEGTVYLRTNPGIETDENTPFETFKIPAGYEIKYGIFEEIYPFDEEDYSKLFPPSPRWNR